ncbi:DUF2339 domain-containing protein [bacterium]|nr:DUF2339 domain-containing protein [bacterium]
MSEEIKQLLQKIQSSVDGLSDKINKQEERINSLEQKLGSQKGFISSGAPVPPPPPQFPEDLKREGVVMQGDEKEVVEKKQMDWEERLGGQWFAKIGVAVLVIGISLFLKYAFDNDWIGETGRVVIGLVVGLSLLVWGEKMIKKYFLYAQIISGGGLVILYLSIFAALNFYSLIPTSVAFVSMILVTALGVILSLRYNALSLLGVVIIGGFATPFLVSTGDNHQIILFSYVLLLDLAVLAVSIFKKWHLANFLAFIGTLITSMAWHGEFYTKDQLFSTVAFFTLFFLVYSLSSLIYNLMNREKSTGAEQILTLLSAVSYFGAIYGLMNSDYHSFMSFFAVILAVYYFLWAYFVKYLTPKDLNLYNFLAFLSIGFITLAIPIQFKDSMVTILWSVEAVLLIYLASRFKDVLIYIFGLAVSILTLFRLLFVNASTRLPVDSVALINERFGVFLFVIIATYAVVYIATRAKKENEDNKIIKWGQMFMIALIVANLLTLFSISQEINYHYDQRLRQLSEERNQVIRGGISKVSSNRISPMKTPYDSEEYRKYIEDRDNIEYQKSISLSIFWMIYAIILLVIGFARKIRFARIGGLILLGISIFKLFFLDLWYLGSLYRIISSISLGVVLLLISFAYQKYRDKLKQII